MAPLSFHPSTMGMSVSDVGISFGTHFSTGISKALIILWHKISKKKKAKKPKQKYPQNSLPSCTLLKINLTLEYNSTSAISALAPVFVIPLRLPGTEAQQLWKAQHRGGKAGVWWLVSSRVQVLSSSENTILQS